MRRAGIITLVAGCWLCSLPAYAQGTLAHVAVGGGWQTTITLLNLDASPSTAQLTLYSDGGSPLVVNTSDQSAGSQFSLDVPANGSASLTLTSAGAAVTGWAQVSAPSGAVIRGQAVFLYQPQTGNQWLGTVPLTSGSAGSSACIIPLPTSSAGTILVPFDNTNGQRTGFAIANVSSANQAIAIEFDDSNNTVLAKDTLKLNSLNHTSFMLSDNYPAVANQKGVLRIKATSDIVSVLALFANASGALTSSLPIYQ